MGRWSWSDASGVIATAYIYGTGQGPELVFPSNQTIQTLGGGFSYPYGVAVDGAATFYIGDQGNNAVKGMPSECASSSCVTTLAAAFSIRRPLAVDGSANVYVADTNNSFREGDAPGCASAGCVTMLGGGFDFPLGRGGWTGAATSMSAIPTTTR